MCKAGVDTPRLFSKAGIDTPHIFSKSGVETPLIFSKAGVVLLALFVKGSLSKNQLWRGVDHNLYLAREICWLVKKKIKVSCYDVPF